MCYIYQNMLPCRFPIPDDFGWGQGRPGWKGILYSASSQHEVSMSFKEYPLLQEAFLVTLAHYNLSSNFLGRRPSDWTTSTHLTVNATPGTRLSSPVAVPCFCCFSHDAQPTTLYLHMFKAQFTPPFPLEIGPSNGGSLSEPCSGLATGFPMLLLLLFDLSSWFLSCGTSISLSLSDPLQGGRETVSSSAHLSITFTKCLLCARPWAGFWGLRQPALPRARLDTVSAASLLVGTEVLVRSDARFSWAHGFVMTTRAGLHRLVMCQHPRDYCDHWLSSCKSQQTWQKHLQHPGAEKPVESWVCHLKFRNEPESWTPEGLEKLPGVRVKATRRKVRNSLGHPAPHRISPALRGRAEPGCASLGRFRSPFTGHPVQRNPTFFHKLKKNKQNKTYIYQ